VALSSTALTLLASDDATRPSLTWNQGSQQPTLVTYSFAQSGNAGFEYSSSAFFGTVITMSAEQQAATRQALDAWGSVSGIQFMEVPDGERGLGIDLRFRMAWTGDGNVLGEATYPGWGDVTLSNDYSFGTNRLAPGTEGYWVLMHEIGHALGLKHPFEGTPALPAAEDDISNTVMAYLKWRQKPPAELRAADIEAIQFLYGTQQDEDAFHIQWSWDSALGAIRHQGDGTDQYMKGTAFRDIMLGGGGKDSLYAGAGDDTLHGGDGDDILQGEDGNDTLFGGQGDDLVAGGAGDDTLQGEAGDDRIYGGAGRDLLIGGDGNDMLSGDAGDDRLYGGEGDDALFGGEGNDRLQADAGMNTAAGATGVDTLHTWLFRAEILSLSVTPGLDGVSGRLAGSGEDTTFSGMEILSFSDGRLVFDDADPVAQVARLYQAALGRAPDAVGREYWTAEVMHGAALSTLAEQFLGSHEFIDRFGTPDDAGFVRRAYEQALDREADADGLAYWEGRLAGGTSRAELLAGFSESDENRQLTAPLLANGLWDADDNAMHATRLYLAVLGRMPDASGLHYWTERLGGGESLDVAGEGFATSPEFQSRFSAADNGNFVRIVYANTLGREADATGYDYWVDRLAQGTGRGELVAEFSESKEFILQHADILEHGIVFA
jgi:serralysin